MNTNKLYKFRNIAHTKDYDRTLKCIKEKYLHAAKTKDFPDTFELELNDIKIVYDSNDITNIIQSSEMMNYNKEFFLSSFPYDIKGCKNQNKVKQYKNNIPNKQLEHLLTKNNFYKNQLKLILDEHKELANICSLSETYTDPKMWEDYSNGICIEVEIQNDPNINPIKINYTNTKPTIFLPQDLPHESFDKTKISMRNKLLGYKSESYKFENEIRYVSYEGNRLPLKSISKIFIGYKVNEHLKEYFIKQVHSIDNTIQFYNICKDLEEYKFIQGNEISVLQYKNYTI